MLDKQTVAHLKTGIELATAEEADRFGLMVGALNALTNRRMDAHKQQQQNTWQ
jgi:hypothetical protein